MAATSSRSCWWLNTLIRLLGVMLPPALYLTIFILIPNIQGLRILTTLAAIGFVGGVLLRSWWALAITPASAVAASVLESAIRSYLSDWGRESGLFGTAILLGTPVALGATLGTLAGKLIEKRLTCSQDG